MGDWKLKFEFWKNRKFRFFTPNFKVRRMLSSLRKLKRMMIEVREPDDFHHHLRDGESLSDVVKFAARSFRSVIVMPNLKPPVRTVQDAISYRNRILQHSTEFPDFNPLMTLYLTDNTSPEDIQQAKSTGLIHAVKYYPAGATTNSEFGVTSLAKVERVLQVRLLLFE